MSYILDALKKADQERAAGNVPDLETVHLHEPTVRKHYRWLWILAALFIFNGVLVALLATRHDAGVGGDAPGRRAAPDERVSALPDTTRPRLPAESAPVVRKAPSRVVRTAPQVQERPRVAVTRPVSPRYSRRPCRICLPHRRWLLSRRLPSLRHRPRLRLRPRASCRSGMSCHLISAAVSRCRTWTCTFTTPTRSGALFWLICRNIVKGTGCRTVQ